VIIEPLLPQVIGPERYPAISTIQRTGRLDGTLDTGQQLRLAGAAAVTAHAGEERADGYPASSSDAVGLVQTGRSGRFWDVRTGPSQLASLIIGACAAP
jgi:hypothetical protein